MGPLAPTKSLLVLGELVTVVERWEEPKKHFAEQRYPDGTTETSETLLSKI